MKVILINETNLIFLSHIQTLTCVHFFVTKKSEYNNYVGSIVNKDKSFYYNSDLGNKYPIIGNEIYIKYNIDKILIYH
uniref:Uncharacterized protein n=1 Tax=viral metagenome TaxID=1070528 RepID=A0A6C0J8L3_9ZZZZ